MLILVDPGAATPLFEQLAAAIRVELAAGRIRSGERLPSARELGAALGVNLHTVLHGYRLLRDEGLIQLRRGRGAVVTERADALRELEREVTALAAAAVRLGFPVDTAVGLLRAAS